MNTDLESRLRALRRDLPEPPAGIDLTARYAVTTTAAPESAAPAQLVAASTAAMRTRRYRRRWLALPLAAALAGSVVAGAVVVGHQHRAAPAATLPGYSDVRPDPATQVVRDGDRVQATGSVLVLPDEPPRLCAPLPVPARANLPPEAYCPLFVSVPGLNPDALSGRRVQDGAVTGHAQVTGTLQGDTLVDIEQGPGPGYAQPVEPARPFSDIPCPTPPGGWALTSGTTGELAPVDRYRQAHPDEIVEFGYLWPSTAGVIAYVLTAGDPAPVDAALRPVIGPGLCVVHSVYSADQVQHAETAVSAVFGSVHRADGHVWLSGSSYVDDGQMAVSVGLLEVTPEIAAIADEQPAGLVVFDPFLEPA